MNQTTKQDQATIAGSIFGAVALLLLTFAAYCTYAVATSASYVAPAVVPAIALFGLLGCGATLAAICAFKAALQ